MNAIMLALVIVVNNVMLPITAFTCGFVVAKGRLPRRSDFRRGRESR